MNDRARIDWIEENANRILVNKDRMGLFSFGTGKRALGPHSEIIWRDFKSSLREAIDIAIAEAN